MKLTTREIIELCFLPIMTAGVFVLWDLNKSVGTLNVQVGVLISESMVNKEQIVDLKRRLEKLEDRTK